MKSPILEMFYWGMDTMQIAEQLQIPEPTVYRQLHDERDDDIGKQSHSARIIPHNENRGTQYHGRRWEIL